MLIWFLASLSALLLNAGTTEVWGHALFPHRVFEMVAVYRFPLRMRDRIELSEELAANATGCIKRVGKRWEYANEEDLQSDVELFEVCDPQDKGPVRRWMLEDRGDVVRSFQEQRRIAIFPKDTLLRGAAHRKGNGLETLLKDARALGTKGKGIHVAVFDTGVARPNWPCKNFVESTNWIGDDPTMSIDRNGHGSGVAGVICSSKPDCEGIAPEASLHVMRISSQQSDSSTSWFLDAFNYAMHSDVHLINLSLGGPDYMDEPFVNKIRQVTGKGVLVVAAVGNDGPGFGTIQNPADQIEVLGVGGLDIDETNVAGYSSRGMTTWEFPRGMGRVKPDVVTHSKDIPTVGLDSACTSISGTSMATPVATGVLALVAASAPDPRYVNPARLKQSVMHSAKRLKGYSMYEQGAGRLDLKSAVEYMRNKDLALSSFPEALDWHDTDYMYPHSLQKFFPGCEWQIMNITVLNPFSVVGHVIDPPKFQLVEDIDQYDSLRQSVKVAFSWSPVLWPYFGWIGVFIRVLPGLKVGPGAEMFVSGRIILRVQVFANSTTQEKLSIPVRFKIVESPLRHQRILFDQFHNVNYPPRFVPKDEVWLGNNHEIGPGNSMDWPADHLFTTYLAMYDRLVRIGGYTVETLRSDFTTFDAGDFGALVIIDPERDFEALERHKLVLDLCEHDLGVIILADWYSPHFMKRMHSLDEDTGRWWTPVTGGSNIPALNQLLKPFQIRFRDDDDADLYSGTFMFGEALQIIDSSTSIEAFPRNGQVLETKLFAQARQREENVFVLGIVDLSMETGPKVCKQGRIAVFVDSSCISGVNHLRCWEAFQYMLEATLVAI